MKILHFFKDGGPVFTYTILILLLFIIGLFVIGIIKSENRLKVKELIIHIGWFTIAWGMLGKTFGLINAFDNVSAAGDITPRLLAGGLKMALVNPLFSIIVFLIARVAVIILTGIEKK